jgi:hypothetical protein
MGYNVLYCIDIRPILIYPRFTDFPLLPRDLVGLQTPHPHLQALRVRLSTSVGSRVSGEQLAA